MDTKKGSGAFSAARAVPGMGDTIQAHPSRYSRGGEMTASNGTDPLASLSTLGGIIDAIIKKTVAETIKAMQASKPQAGKLLTVKELAGELQISPYSIYEKSRRGEIPCHRVGKSLRFDLQEVLASQAKKD
jgi:excisionase family DNA binding protein